MSKLALVFPGQGPQSVGMLSELASSSDIIEKTFNEATEVLGFDAWKLAQVGPAEILNQTENTQPLLLAASVAMFRLYSEKRLAKPFMMAGHSLGEYSALVCAGSLDFHLALALVKRRGELMQAAVPNGVGAMAAIVGLDDIKVQEVCETVSEGYVAPANFNSVGQVVISGEKAAVEAVCLQAKTAGAKLAKVLPVSVPSHCDLMRPAAVQFAEELANTAFKTPKCAVINNVDVDIKQHPDDIRDALMRQLYCPVRWVETVELLKAEGADKIMECGPGKVLAGLIKRIDRDIEVIVFPA